MTRPRVGFLGVGWIGRDRMRAMVENGAIEAVGVADPDPKMSEAAAELAPTVAAVDGLDDLLDLGLDGVVIATPSALHAEQSIAALERGVAVFCQKPLGRHAGETRAVVESAERANRLLGVDFSYRHCAALTAVRELVRSGELGTIHVVDLVFHNAYGPGKPWFYDRALSGGGCLMDLGVHLIDLALWTLDDPEITYVSRRLLTGGSPTAGDQVEDYATALLEFDGRVAVRLACSWNLHAGRGADISAAFYGSEGGAAFRNVDGSFYDFTAHRFRGDASELLASPADAWGGRAAVAWAQRLAQDPAFDHSARGLIRVSEALDRIYRRA